MGYIALYRGYLAVYYPYIADMAKRGYPGYPGSGICGSEMPDPRMCICATLSADPGIPDIGGVYTPVNRG